MLNIFWSLVFVSCTNNITTVCDEWVLDQVDTAADCAASLLLSIEDMPKRPEGETKPRFMFICEETIVE